MQDEKKYNDSIHFIGRVGSIIAVAFMVGIPVVVCAVYKCFPDMKTVSLLGLPFWIMSNPV